MNQSLKEYMEKYTNRIGKYVYFTDNYGAVVVGELLGKSKLKYASVDSKMNIHSKRICVGGLKIVDIVNTKNVYDKKKTVYIYDDDESVLSFTNGILDRHNTYDIPKYVISVGDIIDGDIKCNILFDDLYASFYKLMNEQPHHIINGIENLRMNSPKLRLAIPSDIAKITGKIVKYYDEGTIKFEMDIKLGKVDGLVKTYDTYGNITHIMELKNNVCDGTFEIHYPPNITMIADVKDGKYNGIMRVYRGDDCKRYLVENDVIKKEYYSRTEFV